MDQTTWQGNKRIRWNGYLGQAVERKERCLHVSTSCRESITDEGWHAAVLSLFGIHVWRRSLLLSTENRSNTQLSQTSCHL